MDLTKPVAKGIRCLLLLCCTSVFAGTPESYKLEGVPDLTQSELVGSDTGDGQQFCAPVAASNALVWLAKRKGHHALLPGDQISLSKTLGSADFMNTNVDEGTNASEVLRGLEKYLASKNVPVKKLTFQGWRKVAPKFSSGKVPELALIRETLSKDGVILLNVGWYRQQGEKYQRNSGHWLTLVGFEKDKLLIHDPAPRAGKTPSVQAVTFSQISSGTLEGKNSGLPVPAQGFFSLGGELRIRKGNDLAILDGAVILEL